MQFARHREDIDLSYSSMYIDRDSSAFLIHLVRLDMIVSAVDCSHLS